MGNKYGKLTVVEFVRTNKNTTFWNCLCECGNTKITSAHSLRRGMCKSCKICSPKKLMPIDGPYKRRWNNHCVAAKKHNRTNELTYDTFVQMVNQNCYWCGQVPSDVHYAYSLKRKTKGIESDVSAKFNGIDRLDSSRGYELDNVVSCCNMCNRMKSDFSVDIFTNQVKLIYENYIKEN